MSAPYFDLEQAQRFLERLAPDESVTFQTYSDKEELIVKRDGKRFDPNAKIMHGTLETPQDADLLTRLNAKGAGVFVMVNEGNGKGRAAKNVQRVRALFIDTDGAPYPAELPLKPHLVVQSSPGRWHLYWLVTGVLLDSFSTLQEALAEHYGTDPSIKDLPRVMRLPGFYHRKGEPVPVELLTCNDHAPYSPSDIFGAWPFLTEKLERERAAQAEKEKHRAEAIEAARERREKRQGVADDTDQKRAEALLEAHCRTVEAAPDGERHDTLLSSARALGGYVGGGYLEAHEVADALQEAAETCGLPETEAAAVIGWGLSKGADDPLKLEDRETGHLTFSSTKSPFDENGSSSNRSPWLSQKTDLMNTSRTQIGRWANDASPWGKTGDKRWR